jgi:hypothetical protein
MSLAEENVLEDVKLTLENDNRCYQWCTKFIRNATMDRFIHMVHYYYPTSKKLSPGQKVYLRTYFIWRWIKLQEGPEPEYCPSMGTPSPTPKLSYSDVDKLSSWAANAFTSPPPQEFKPMSKLVFKQQFLLNGVDVSTLDNSAIYQAIAAEEARIAKLKEISNQPKSLKAEIETAEAQLKALVTHLDAK